MQPLEALPAAVPAANPAVPAAVVKDPPPVAAETGGPVGPEPTRFGDWERRGRCIDF